MILRCAANEILTADLTANAGSLIDALQSFVVSQLRLTRYDTGEQALLNLYTRAAVQAVEEYIDKDVLERQNSIAWRSGILYLSRGRISSLAVTTGDSPPEAVDYDTSGSRIFGKMGLRLHPSTGVEYPLSVTFLSGFASIDLVPPALLSFILVFVGMLFENRELANTGTVSYEIKAMPLFLLDPFAGAVFA